MLQLPLSFFLKGVWKKNLTSLKKLGLFKVEDLLFYFPTKYKDFSKIKKISELKIGEEASVKGKIIKAEIKKTLKTKRTIFEIIIDDGTGLIKGVWFGKPYLLKILKPGKEVYLAGKAYFDDFYGFYLFLVDSVLQVMIRRIFSFFM